MGEVLFFSYYPFDILLNFSKQPDNILRNFFLNNELISSDFSKFLSEEFKACNYPIFLRQL